MEFLNGICKKEVTEWDELTGTSLLNQEVVLEGAVHSIRNMGDVAFHISKKADIFRSREAQVDIGIV